MCPSFRDVNVWKENVHLRTDEIQLKIGLMWGLGELIWAKLSEQSWHRANIMKR